MSHKQVPPKVDAILKQIYEDGLTEQDLAMVVRRVFQALEDSFYEEPPSDDQQNTLNQLLAIADRIERFYK